MTLRRRLVRVPASSANLGPGFDVLAAALSLHLELEVSEAGEFSVDAGGDPLPEDRSNLCVRAFEALHSADGLRFEIRSEIPFARGLGSSAAAIVAGLMAADHLYELALDRDEIYRRAVELEGHPDNVAAALFGGIALCPREAEGDELPPPIRLEPPEGVEPVLVIPDEEVATAQARAALPPRAPLARRDRKRRRGRPARPRDRALGPDADRAAGSPTGCTSRTAPRCSRARCELVAQARDFGAIGASISGAGPTVLVWCFWQDTGKVADALDDARRGLGRRPPRPFTPLGADVVEL